MSKIRHRASRAVQKLPGSDKGDILDLYAKIQQKQVKSDPDFPELLETETPIDLGSILEKLRSSDSDVVVGALKELERNAYEQRVNIPRVHSLIVGILKSHSNEKVRQGAVRTVARMKDSSAVDDLVFVIKNDESEMVKEAAVKALGSIKVGACFGLLVDIINDIWNQSIRVRKAAAFALGRLDPINAANILTDSLINDPDKDVRKEAAEGIAICFMKMVKEKVNVVAKTVSAQSSFEEEPDYEVRISVISALIISENSDCLDALIFALKKDPHPRVRGEAANALSHFFNPRAERALIESLSSESEDVLKRVALALAHYALRNPLGLHDEMCKALIHVQKLFPKGSYVWKEAVRALPAC